MPPAAGPAATIRCKGLRLLTRGEVPRLRARVKLGMSAKKQHPECIERPTVSHLPLLVGPESANPTGPKDARSGGGTQQRPVRPRSAAPANRWQAASGPSVRNASITRLTAANIATSTSTNRTAAASVGQRPVASAAGEARGPTRGPVTG